VDDLASESGVELVDGDDVEVWHVTLLLCRVPAMRRTMAARAVARALLANPNPDAFHWGYDLSKRADIPSGVLYPILARMEADGWLTSDWDDSIGGRPRRRYYQLTDTGRTQLAAFVDGANR
jgi:PadR family transcriptional regulator PadR